MCVGDLMFYHGVHSKEVGEIMLVGVLIFWACLRDEGLFIYAHTCPVYVSVTYINFVVLSTSASICKH